MLAATASPGSREELLERLRAQVAAKEGRFRQRVLPVPRELAGILPDGGLKPGCAYSLTGSGALLLALLAAPSRDGHWCGVVGIPEFGAEAAGLAGVALERLALVPDPQEHWLAVLAALVEAVPVVAVRPAGKVPEGVAARLMSRLRDREAVLLVNGSWPRTEARLSADAASWAGVGDGNGHLERREVTISVTSRRSSGSRSVRLLLPAADGRPAAADGPAAVQRPTGYRAAG